MTNPAATYNPELLDQLSCEARMSGAQHFAEQLSALAKQWRTEQRTLADAQRDNSELQHRINAIARQATAA